MKHASDLKRNLFSIDGKSYSMYKELRGSYRFDGYLSLIHISTAAEISAAVVQFCSKWASPLNSGVSVMVRTARNGIWFT